MAYPKTTWATGDVIDKDKLNKMEQGIHDNSTMLDVSTVTSANDTDTTFINQSAGLRKITLSNLASYIKNKIGSLKNPYKIKFTGAVTEEYDGSAEVTINIPTSSGSGGGTDGEDGATFTPSVSSDGILSWTNDKGLSNPASVNIKGPKGDPGSTSYDAGSVDGYSVSVVTQSQYDSSSKSSSTLYFIKE